MARVLGCDRSQVLVCRDLGVTSMANVDQDRLHRSIKLALDTGQAATLEEAERLFGSYRLMIQVGRDVAHSATLQASLLTAVNTGRRCFLGGVEVTGYLDVPLLIPWRRCVSLGEAIVDLQGKWVEQVAPEIPRIIIGNVDRRDAVGPFAVSVICSGWSGGVVPLEDRVELPRRNEFTPSGVLAGALGVSEAFQFIRGDNPYAGRRAMGLSLWKPEDSRSWLDLDAGPVVESLPARLWLIGLGHLGQAFLWTLGILPYARPDQVQLVLQDFDELVEANDSTSLLTDLSLMGLKKTRAIATWCEGRGFRSQIVERRFANNFRVDDDEPQVAVCGVDNALARAEVESVGFARVVEAGLGKGAQEYLSFQMHTLPASRSARERWGSPESGQESLESLKNQPAYRALASAGHDDCGITQIAGRSVGASFVGAVTSAVVIGELVRMAMGANAYEVIDGDLRASPVDRAVINRTLLDPFNPGCTQAQKQSS